MTKAQKDNQLRFKKAQAEAKRLKAKNPKLSHTAAVKQAFKNIAGTSAKPAAKKIGAVKLDVIKKPIGLYYDNKLIKQFDTVAQSNKYQIEKVQQGYNRNLFFTQKFSVTAPAKKKVTKKQTGKTNIAIDRKIQALPIGKRISKSGNVYYEARANRSDKGKLLGVKSIKSLYKKYQDNENVNYHTENILLLAENFGSALDKKAAKKLITDADKYGYSTQANIEKANVLNKKLYPKLIAAYKKETGIGAVKKPAISKHKDTNSHNVKISIMSGVGKFHAHEEYKKIVNYIIGIENIIAYNQSEIKRPAVIKYQKDKLKKELVYLKKLLKEYKTHARELKKLL
jgi:hypothetical protein